MEVDHALKAGAAGLLTTPSVCIKTVLAPTVWYRTRVSIS